MRVGLGEMQCIQSDAQGNCVVESDPSTGAVQTAETSLPLFSTFPSQLPAQSLSSTLIPPAQPSNSISGWLSANSSSVVAFCAIAGLFIAAVARGK